MSKSRICVAAITGSYGVKGEARVKSFCAEPTAFADYGALASEDGKTTYELSITGAVKGGFSVNLGGKHTKEQVDALKGNRLYAPRDRLPHLPDDEYYYTDLVGLDVYDTGGVKIGRVHAVQNFGAEDLLELVGGGIKGSVFLPFTQVAVPTVDLSARRIIVDAPAGVFDDG